MNQGLRLDLFVAQKITDVSRSRIQKLIRENLVRVNGKQVKLNYKLKEKDFIEVLFPKTKEIVIEPEDLPLQILYEDQDIIVVNKEQGMVVHPAPGNYSKTLVNALLFYGTDLSDINGALRPGIVHRIDKDTTGVLVIAKNNPAHICLAKQFKEHSVKRIYWALVCGDVTEPGGIINVSIGRHPVDRKRMAVGVKNSKDALTKYRVLERFGDYTLVEAELKTGRTHQIRVHMKHAGYSLVGDPKYSGSKNRLGFSGQALHAMMLGFDHPRSGRYLEFRAKLPEPFEEMLKELRRH